MNRARDQFDSTSFDTASGATQSLLDLCTDAFLLIFYIHEGKDPGQPDQLRKEISLLLQDLDKRGRKSGYSDEDLKATRYALCALLDETILNSRWSYKDQWADSPLQLEHFGEHMAGERFFDLLERIRKKGSRKVDLLEVFCLALILGFQGRYKLRGGEDLNNLIRELVGEIHGHRGGAPRGLAPHWSIPEEAVERPARTVPRWVWITGLTSILLVILIFVVFKFWLGSAVSEAVSRMIV
jgi:type VI secretion system protein ImpK